MMESLLSIRRAGATIILTYYAKDRPSCWDEVFRVRELHVWGRTLLSAAFYFDLDLEFRRCTRPPHSRRASKQSQKRRTAGSEPVPDSPPRRYPPAAPWLWKLTPTSLRSSSETLNILPRLQAHKAGHEYVGDLADTGVVSVDVVVEKTRGRSAMRSSSSVMRF